MLADVQNLGAGILLGLSLAAPPGPVNAVIAVQATRRSWWAGARVGLGATFGDVIYLAVFALGLGRLLARSPTAQGLLSLAGAAIMLYFAWGAWRTFRAPPEDVTEGAERARGEGFLAGLGLVLTSPYNIAWWTSAGMNLLAQFGPAIIAGLFLGVLLWVTTFPALLRFGEARIRNLNRIVAAASALVLLGFGAWFAWQGVRLVS